jgi:hypothetical protein
MAQGGSSGRTGGKTKPGSGGKNASTSRGTTSSRGATGSRGSVGRPPKSAKSAKQAAAAIKGARSGNKVWQVVVPAAVVVIVAAAVVVGVLLSNKGSNSASTSPENGDTSTAILASTTGQSNGDAVDGVQSNDMEQVLFHIHAHLAIYVNGTQKLLPYGVGIVPPYQLQQTSGGPFVAGGSKYYWLHTHDETGVIHIESPVQRTFTLGNFFDVWKQPLSATQVGPDKGTVDAYVNGKAYTGDPRNIPLTAHAVIQLNVGKPMAFQNYTFASGL